MTKYEQQLIEFNLKDKIEYESQPIVETDNMGKEKFWEDLGRPDNK
jgi:hypothetical protein